MQLNLVVSKPKPKKRRSKGRSHGRSARRQRGVSSQKETPAYRETRKTGSSGRDSFRANGNAKKVSEEAKDANEARRESSEVKKCTRGEKEVVSDEIDGTTNDDRLRKRPFGSRRCPRKDASVLAKRPRYAEGARAPKASKRSDHIFATDSTTRFGSLGLSAAISNLLHDGGGAFGFDRPTRVQQLAVPKLLSGRDALIKSETGSGKTLAYLLPIVQRLSSITPRVQRSQGTRAIILLPTRELCVQTFAVLKNVLAPFHWIVPGLIVGGDKRKAEKARLRKGLTIVAATPGRLVDHLKNTDAFRVSRLNVLVLDEADRLLDLGFEPQVHEMLQLLTAKLCPQERQSVLISATLERHVKSLASSTLRDPILIDADGGESENPSTSNGQVDSKDGMASDGTFKTPKQLAQHYVETPVKQRFVALFAFLKEQCVVRAKKLVVFLSCCDSVEYHHTMLRRLFSVENVDLDDDDHATADKTKPSDIDPLRRSRSQRSSTPSRPRRRRPVLRLHGNMPKSARGDALRRFCDSPSAVMLCTDVAARGLNLPSVDWIVQFDPPHEVREYVHRVGRTARSGAGGRSLLFVTPSEVAYVNLLATNGLTLQRLATNTVLNGLILDENGEDVAGKTKTSLSGKARRKAIVMSMAGVQAKIEGVIERDDDLRVLAARAYRSHTRAYAAHPKSSKKIFRVRALHFGHVAKSFGLKESPSALGNISSGKFRKVSRGPPKRGSNETVEGQNPAAVSRHEFYEMVRKTKKSKMLSEFAA